ncbi:MAG: TonB-dependent receptor [Bacteroidales bacterium]|nr:MAG: TonB-dependent receptor [Bacteroidales bacterium]
MRRISLFLIFISVVTLSYAQSDTISADSEKLAEVVVTTGTGTEHYIKDAPVQTEVVSGKALRTYAGRSIEDILSAMVASFSFNGNDMGSGMQLNGLGNGYILIMLDGKKLNGDLGGQNDLNTIPLDNIERIEIVKGASSALYGSDAIAGVVNFITKKNRSPLSITNNTRVGCYADIKQNNTISFKIGRLNATTLFNFKHTDGWKNTTQEYYRNRLVNNSVTRTVNHSFNYKLEQALSFDMTSSLNIKAKGSYYQRYAFRPTGYPQYQLKNFYYRDVNTLLDATYKLSKFNKISADLSYAVYQYFYDYKEREYTDFFDENNNRIIYFPGDRVLQSSQQRLLTRLKGIFVLGKKHILNSGFECNYESLLSPMRIAKDKDASAYTVATYMQDEYNVTNKFNVTTGFRWVYHKAFGNIITPKISAMYKLGDFNLRTTYSNGFKAPTVKQLYYSYVASIMTTMKAYYGDETLRPQRSNYYSLGIEYNGIRVQSNLSIYYNRVRDMIALMPIPTSPEDKKLEVEETLKYTNLSKAWSYGADFSLDIKFNNEFSIGGSYSYLDAKAQEEDYESDYYMQFIPINGTSKHNANIRVLKEYAWGNYRLGVGVYGRFQSARFYVTDGNTMPYQLWRLNTSHSITSLKNINLDINIGIDNLFNFVDRTPFGHNRATTSPGRTAYLSLAFQLKNKKTDRHNKKCRSQSEYRKCMKDNSDFDGE